ncbi:MAG: anhydro-N-acetylmuramic acid kinase [Pseudomonadota bacterium]
MADYYVGLMSGTSMDGIDVGLTRIRDDTFEFVAGQCAEWPADVADLLRHAINHPMGVTLDSLGDLDVAVGLCFATAVLELLVKQKVAARDVAAIGSHGQTIRHRPDARRPFTTQIGDPNVIAARTGITTVADFRRRDLALGGQGAPLASAFHRAAFASPDEDRAVVNVGGIGNVTLLGADGSVSGFDTGPGNTLMDQWIKRHLGEPYDAEGDWAASGKTDMQLLRRLRADEYFTLEPPKSTGREYFNVQWLTGHLLTLPAAPEPRDVQATLCDLTAHSIADAVTSYGDGTRRCILCGGGARNWHLIHRLQSMMPGVEIQTTADFGLEPAWVEAATFAWLAYRTIHGLAGNLPAVTGARKDAILGGVYAPALPASG